MDISANLSMESNGHWSWITNWIIFWTPSFFESKTYETNRDYSCHEYTNVKSRSLFIRPRHWGLQKFGCGNLQDGDIQSCLIRNQIVAWHQPSYLRFRLIMITKERLLDSIDSLPQSFSAEEIIQRIILLEKIETGLAESASGQEIDDSELPNHLPEWLSWIRLTKPSLILVKLLNTLVRIPENTRL